MSFLMNHLKQLPKNKASTSTETASDLCPRQEQRLNPALNVGVVGAATLVSPSTDAEYDELMDVEAVPLPDGNVCLLALPSECSQGEGPAGMSCLKLFSRYITDRKGVVSGILLVTSNKIFFDPQKSHPLVQEHGCEEYVFSCSVDDLASVSFYTDISHIHFNKTTYRFNSCKPSKSKKEHKKTHQSALEAAPAPKSFVSHDPTAISGANPEEEDEEGGEAGDMAKAERQLTLESGGMLTAAATFCCGGPDSVQRGNKAYGHTDRTKQQSYLERQLLGTYAATSSSGINGSLMFVRIRHKLQYVKKKAFSKPKIPSRDAWFTLQQERSDELYAYLSQHRQDLCILEGGEEDEAECDEEDFVLLDEEEQEEEEGSPREGQAGEDWEDLCKVFSVEELLKTNSFPISPASGTSETVTSGSPLPLSLRPSSPLPLTPSTPLLPCPSPKRSPSPCSISAFPAPSISPCFNASPSSTELIPKRKSTTEDTLLKILEQLDWERERAMQQDSEDFRFAAVIADMLAKIDPQLKSEVKFKIYQILYEAGQKKHTEQIMFLLRL
uniref:Uncharacterized protein n=1 Tax=Sinocyclocheilus anshuiensis TaxID=1608454 RepID=A0A671MMU1_9TELE